MTNLKNKFQHIHMYMYMYMYVYVLLKGAKQAKLICPFVACRFGTFCNID